MLPVSLPELLAPAGNWHCARAAVENGADAIYFGLDHGNARLRADNFTLTDLPELMGFLHQRGVKGYLTLNTLVFAGELPAMEKILRPMIAAGVDAAIVQDLGLCRLIRHLSPDFPLHASTQMTITSAAGVAFARALRKPPGTLRDRVGTEHALQADAGCRNTLFNGVAQTGADYAHRLIQAGARHFRLEFLQESPEQVMAVINQYHRLLAGEISGPQLWRQLHLQSQLGVTRGPLNPSHRPITAPYTPPF